MEYNVLNNIYAMSPISVNDSVTLLPSITWRRIPPCGISPSLPNMGGDRPGDPEQADRHR